MCLTQPPFMKAGRIPSGLPFLCSDQTIRIEAGVLQKRGDRFGRPAVEGFGNAVEENTAACPRQTAKAVYQVSMTLTG